VLYHFILQPFVVRHLKWAGGLGYVRGAQLMVDGRRHPETVVTNVTSLDEAPGALRDHRGVDAVKTILVA